LRHSGALAPSRIVGKASVIAAEAALYGHPGANRELHRDYMAFSRHTTRPHARCYHLGAHSVTATDYFRRDWRSVSILRSTGYSESSRHCTSAGTAIHVACLNKSPSRAPLQEGPTPSSWPSNLGSRFETSAHFSLPSTRPEMAAQISSSPPRTCSVESRSRSVKVLSLTDWNCQMSVSRLEYKQSSICPSQSRAEHSNSRNSGSKDLRR
jgi:hypothetical protein